MNYGELIDSDYNNVRPEIYSYFTEYFGNPTMTKVSSQGEYCVYLAEVSCLLNREKRYLVLVIQDDGKLIRTQEMMENLQWESLQTRTRYDKNHVIEFKYISRRFPPLMDTIHLINKTDKQIVYHSKNLPLVITLLPDSNGKLDYQDKGVIVTALETFQTIITFK